MYFIDFLISTNYLSGRKTATKVWEQMEGKTVTVFYEFDLIENGNATHKANSTDIKISASDLVKSDLSVASGSNTVSYIYSTLNVTYKDSSGIEQGVGNGYLQNFVLKSFYISDQKYMYYTFDDGSDLKYGIQFADNGWKSSHEKTDRHYVTSYYYKQKYVKVVTTKYSSNFPYYMTSVRFNGFNKLSTKLNTVPCYFVNDQKKQSQTFSVSLGDSAYTSIIKYSKDVINVSSYSNLVIDFNIDKILPVNTTEDVLNEFGYTTLYTLNGNGEKKGRDDYRTNTLTSKDLKNLFYLKSNNGSYSPNPNENFSNLYPRWVEGATDWKITQNKGQAYYQNIDWYNWRFENATNQTKQLSAYESYLFCDKQIYDKNKDIAYYIKINDSNITVSNIYEAWNFTKNNSAINAAAYLGPLTVCYTNMYYNDGIMDIYYNTAYTLTKTLNVHTDSFKTFGENSCKKVNGYAYYVGWLNNNNYNDTFKKVKDDLFKYQLVLLGTYISLKDSGDIATNYKESIKYSNLSSYAKESFQYVDLKLDKLSKKITYQEFYNTTDPKYSTSFIEFDTYINTTDLFDQTRYQIAWNGSSENVIVTDKTYSYLGLNLLLVGNKNGKREFSFDENSYNGGIRTGWNGSMCYTSNSIKYSTPVSINETTNLKYTYQLVKNSSAWIIDDNISNGSVRYTNEAIRLDNSKFGFTYNQGRGGAWQWYKNSGAMQLSNSLNNNIVQSFVETPTAYSILLTNEVVVDDFIDLSPQSGSTGNAKIYFKYYNSSSNNYKNKIEYSVESNTKISDEVLNNLVVYSQLSKLGSIGENLGKVGEVSSITMNNSDGLNDTLTFPIFTVKSSSNLEILYQTIKVVINYDSNQTKFDTFSFVSEGAKDSTKISASPSPAEVSLGNDFTCKFFENTANTTLEIYGVSLENYSKLQSLSTTFNFTSSSVQTDKYYFVNGFDDSVYIKGSDEVKSHSCSKPYEFTDDATSNFYITSLSKLFQIDSSYQLIGRDKNYCAYFESYRFDEKDVRTITQCYVNTNNLIYNGDFFGYYSDILSFNLNFESDKKTTTYIWLGGTKSKLPSDLQSKINDAVKIIYQAYATYPVTTIETSLTGARTSAPATSAPSRWYNDAKILTKSFKEISMLYDKNVFRNAKSTFLAESKNAFSSYLNVDFVTDSSLPVFKLNENIYKYEGNQSNPTSKFGFTAPINFEDIYLVAYYKPNSKLVDKDKYGGIYYNDNLTSWKKINPNTGEYGNSYITNNYNWKNGKKSSVFSVPLMDVDFENTDGGTIKPEETTLGFVLNNIKVVKIKNNPCKFVNTYLKSCELMENECTDLFKSFNSCYFNLKSSYVLPNKFQTLSSITIDNLIHQEIQKLNVSYLSVYSYKYNFDKSTTNWSSQFSCTNMDQLKSLLPMYKDSYNGINVNIYMLGQGLSSSYLNLNRPPSNGTKLNLGSNFCYTYLGLNSQTLTATNLFGTSMIFNSVDNAVKTYVTFNNDLICTETGTNENSYYLSVEVNGVTSSPRKTSRDSSTFSLQNTDLIDLNKIYSDSQKHPDEKTLEYLYRDQLGSLMKLSIPTINDFKILKVSYAYDDIQRGDLYDVDEDHMSNFQIKRNEKYTYWDDNYTYINTLNGFNPSIGVETLNLDSSTLMRTIDLTYIFEVTDTAYIPYYYPGCKINFEDSMFQTKLLTTYDGTSYSYSYSYLDSDCNLYNYIATTNSYEMIQDIEVTNVYFGNFVDNSISISDTYGGKSGSQYSMQFCVAQDNVVNFGDQYNQKVNKRLNNKATTEWSDKEHSIKIGYTLSEFILNENNTDITDNYLYKFFAKRFDRVNLNVFWNSKLNFSDNLNIKYNLYYKTSVNSYVYSYSSVQTLNMTMTDKNADNYGFIKFNTIAAKLENNNQYYIPNQDAVYTITNNMIGRLCPIIKNCIYIKAIPNKSYKITYKLTNSKEDVNSKTTGTITKTIKNSDLILNIGNGNGGIYKYLHIFEFDYDGIKVPGYTVNLQNYFDFED